MISLAQAFFFTITDSTMMEFRQQNNLPGEAVLSLSPAVFKATLDTALSNPVWSHSQPCSEQEPEHDDLQTPLPTWITLWSDSLNL